jgi:hypothetical protein
MTPLRVLTKGFSLWYNKIVSNYEEVKWFLVLMLKSLLARNVHSQRLAKQERVDSLLPALINSTMALLSNQIGDATMGSSKTGGKMPVNNVQVRIVRPLERFGVDIHMIWKGLDGKMYSVERDGFHVNMTSSPHLVLEIGKRFNTPLLSMPEECYEALVSEILQEESVVNNLEKEISRLRQTNTDLSCHLEDMRRVAFQALGITMSGSPISLAPPPSIVQTTQLSSALGRLGSGRVGPAVGSPYPPESSTPQEVYNVQEGQAEEVEQRPTWPENRREAADPFR